MRVRSLEKVENREQKAKQFAITGRVFRVWGEGAMEGQQQFGPLV